VGKLLGQNIAEPKTKFGRVFAIIEVDVRKLAVIVKKETVVLQALGIIVDVRKVRNISSGIHYQVPCGIGSCGVSIFGFIEIIEKDLPILIGWTSKPSGINGEHTDSVNLSGWGFARILKH
jgi:hypothetical protein